MARSATTPFLLLLLLLFVLSNQIDAEKETCSSSNNDDGTCQTTTTTTPENEINNDPCKDLNEECPKWAMEGQCGKNPGYMIANCARSCNVCTPLSGEKRRTKAEEDKANEVNCRDLHELCSRWADAAECTINPSYMLSACRDSCYVCVNLKESRERGDSEDLIRRKKIFMDLDFGSNQIQPEEATPEEKLEIQKVLKSMDQYARTYLTDESTPREIQNRCRNEFDQCAYWASKGMCTDKIVYMLNNCPFACRYCDRTEQFHRCTGKRHPLDAPAVTNGETDNGVHQTMDDLFRAMEQDTIYGPEIVTAPTEENTKDPWMIRFDSFLSADECDHLVELGETIGWTLSGLEEKENFMGNPAKMVPRRSSRSAFCQIHDPASPCTADPTLQNMVRRIASVTGISERHIETVEFRRYSVKQTFGVHHDYRIHDSWKPSGPRILSVLLFLSDVKEGGAEGFPDLDWLFVKAKKGQALLWSNVQQDDASAINPLLIHEGLPVLDGTKIVANFWIHLYDWKTPFERKCT